MMVCRTTKRDQEKRERERAELKKSDQNDEGGNPGEDEEERADQRGRLLFIMHFEAQG